MDFTIYTPDTAPEASKPLLEEAKQSLGFIPNLLGEFAESPAVLEGYLRLNAAVGKTDLSAREQQVAILAVSMENQCHYCTAVHSTVLRSQLNTDDAIVDAVRNGTTVPDVKLDALATYARKVVSDRGFVSKEDIQTFLDAGFTKRHLLEVNLIVALKTITNYTNHLAHTPLDDAFAAEKVEFETA